MAIELPTQTGGRVVFWTEDGDDGGEPSRGVLTSDGAKGWTLTFELGIKGEEGADDLDHDGMWWEDDGGSFRPADLSGFILDLAKAFRDCDRTHSDIIDLMAKGKSELPLRKPVTIARLSGKQRFGVKVTTLGGDSLGRPIMQLTQTRPLIAEEWFVVCKRFAAALDWWSKRMGDA